ncbi:MAG: DUF262 domain-containing protein [Hyphomicrobiaceae bacterium]
MDFRLSAEDLTVAELLSGLRAFVLPEFQRDYSWSAQQAEDLIEDIEAAAADQGRDDVIAPYFIGTFLFAAGGDDASIRDYLIIDGQQRLTTLTVLLAVLRDLEQDLAIRDRLHRHIAVWSPSNAELGDAFHLTPREADRRFFARWYQKLGATAKARRTSLASQATAAQRRVETIRSYFRQRLRRYEPDQRRSLARFVLDGCRLVAMSTPSLDYAYQIFLSINGRGLPLTEDDIVLAEVIGPLDADQRRRYEPIVAQMARYRDGAERSRARGKTFFTHLVAQQGWGARTLIAELRRAVSDAGGARAFARNVFQPLADAYLLTRCEPGTAAGLDPEVREGLERLALLEALCDDEWVGVAMLGLSRLGTSHPETLGFLAALDRFAHAQLAIRPTRSERRKRFLRALRSLRSSDGDFDYRAALSLTPNEQARVLRRCAIGLDDTATRTGKAFLIRLDMMLSGRPASWYRSFVGSLKPGNGVSVEHILPKGRTLPQASPWRLRFPDPIERRALADRIGNLLLVGERQNRRAAQFEWTVKRDGFLADPVSSQFAMVRELADVDDWTREALEARQVAMMKLVTEIWSLDAGAPELSEV